MNNSQFDITVMGAGICGLGVALEAAESGKKVCLLDKAKCGQATSNSSLRIIHGGLRYLQKLDFQRIISSVSDQTYCLKKWPHLVKPLRCVAPLSGRGLKKTNLARIATVLYSCFLGALNSPLEKPYVDPRKNFEGLPFLKDLAPDGFLVWQDALLVDPNALVKEIIKEISSSGAEVLENSNIAVVESDQSGVGISYVDSGGSQNVIKSRFAVNCMGAWLNRISSATGNLLASEWCLAFNVILNKQFSPDTAFGADGEQGRYFFFVPRADKTVLGTAYVKFEGDPDSAKPSESDLVKFIEHARKAVPNLGLSIQDVESVECGILPMKGLDSKGEPLLFGSGKVSKQGNVVQVLNTKYTTFRSQAQEVLKLLT